VHHRRGLRRLLKDDDLLAESDVDWQASSASDKRKVMLAFAIKLTADPGAMERSDVDALRDAGFTDLDVLDIVEVVGYYAYVNRIADGLGVQLEDWYPDDD